MIEGVTLSKAKGLATYENDKILRVAQNDEKVIYRLF
jgi:hypothetical protein